jgi:hypothetical protein
LLMEKAVAVWSGLRSFFIRKVIVQTRRKLQALFDNIDKNIIPLYSLPSFKGGVNE